MMLQVLDFHLEPDEDCEFDFLGVAYPPRIKRECGRKKPRDIQVADNVTNIRLRLKTDASENFRGFWFQFKGQSAILLR